MNLWIENRQKWVMWLSAILILLSVVSSAHAASHLEDGIHEHCTLCFHQHHLSQAAGETSLSLPVIRQTYLETDWLANSYDSITTLAYYGRAPPAIHSKR